MDAVQADTAKKAFEELLYAVWAAQLAQLRTQHSDDSQNGPDSQKTSVKEGDAR